MKGELVCILGPSGCGKTTLLNIVGGFSEPTMGSVRIDGEAVQAPIHGEFLSSRNAECSLGWTSRPISAFGLFNLPKKAKRRRIEYYVGLVGTAGFRTCVSHGTLRWHEAEAGGGPGVGGKSRCALSWTNRSGRSTRSLGLPCARVVANMAGRAQTILFVTHDIEESVQLADRVVVMSARPAQIRRIVEVDIPHPRDISSSRYFQLRDRHFREIGLAHKV